MQYNKRITKEVFTHNLVEAIEESIRFINGYITNKLPAEYKLILRTNCSMDKFLKDDEVVYPKDNLNEKSKFNPTNVEIVADYLYRDGKIPEWIDVFVAYNDSIYTYVVLNCCGRFTSRIDYLYHQIPGIPPFLIRTNAFPPEKDKYDNRIKVELNDWFKKVGL